MTALEFIARSVVTAECCWIAYMAGSGIMMVGAMRHGLRVDMAKPNGQRLDDSQVTDDSKATLGFVGLAIRLGTYAGVIPILWAIWWGRL